MTVKFPAVVAVPPAVVTEILPVVAPVGTAVVIWVALVTVKVAEVLLNFTAVAPVKLVPVMVTGVLTGPAVGAKPEIVGGVTVTVKLEADVAVPPGVVTEIVPLVAPVGTVVVICVALATENVAAVPLKLTAVAPVKFVPEMVTAPPTAALAGVKLEIVGADAVTVKLEADVAVPPAVVTDTLPVVAAAGTVVVIWVALATVNAAPVPLKLTEVAPVKLVPAMVTLAPTMPLAGVKLVMVGVAGGGGVDMLPPPQAASASTKSRVGISLTLAFNGLATVSEAMASAIFGHARGGSKNRELLYLWTGREGRACAAGRTLKDFRFWIVDLRWNCPVGSDQSHGPGLSNLKSQICNLQSAFSSSESSRSSACTGFAPVFSSLRKAT